jgi:hypothetical protein
VLLGILGREVYNFDAADPRFVTEMMLGPLDGGSPAFGGNLYQPFYANIRTGNILLHAMGNLTPTDALNGLTAEEREGILGYTQTMQAYDYLRLIDTRDENGIPLDVDIDPTGEPAPIATKVEAFTRITGLLDEAVTHLAAAGATFPFGFSPGFAGFDAGEGGGVPAGLGGGAGRPGRLVREQLAAAHAGRVPLIQHDRGRLAQ